MAYADSASKAEENDIIYSERKEFKKKGRGKEKDKEKEKEKKSEIPPRFFLSLGIKKENST